MGEGLTGQRQEEGPVGRGDARMFYPPPQYKAPTWR